ncbi:cytochrome P450 [Candidatus Bathyarchaeota archaeon]|nr:cytochrome P450 [Candidatus Bathyarchaeota archaeon]
MATSSFAPWAVAIIASYIVHRFVSSARRHRRFPPGPTPLPLIGNLRDFPNDGDGLPDYEHWLKHKKYGPISSVTAFGQTAVIIHDREAAQVILERMALKTSGRPTSFFGSDICGYVCLPPATGRPYHSWGC